MRDWAQFNLDVIGGTAGGKILWQPRIGCWNDDKKFAGEPLPEPYEGLDLPDIYRELGCSDRLYNWYNPCFKRVEHPSVKFERKELNETDYKVIIRSPGGRQEAVFRRTLSSPHHLTLKWEVETDGELKAAAWREAHTDWEWDGEAYERSLAAVGDLGAPCIFMPRMNIQSLYIEKMGVMNGVYALMDNPAGVEAYFSALEESHDRLMDVICPSPIRIINYGENVHSGTLSPELFLKYHLPSCRRRGEKLRGAGKFVYSHWDGDCRPLLPYLKECDLDGVEAVTPRPQGDVTLEEIKEALGNEMFLLDGIPAVYFDKEYPEEILIEETRRIIDMFAPKLILGVSDEVSSTGDIERVRTVGRLVDEYNVQL